MYICTHYNQENCFLKAQASHQIMPGDVGLLRFCEGCGKICIDLGTAPGHGEPSGGAESWEFLRPETLETYGGFHK